LRALLHYPAVDSAGARQGSTDDGRTLGDSQHYLPRGFGRPSLGPVTVT